MDDSAKIAKIAAWLGSGSINIFGRPFAGKDTQGSRLAFMFDAPLLGGGDILRRSHMPVYVKELNRTGELFPTNIYMELVLPFLSQDHFKGKPLILSAVGRRQGEEAGVLEATAAAGHPIKSVILLAMGEEAVWNRWEMAQDVKDRGKRDDDSYEALKVRLDEFRNKTMPVIDFYRTEKLLIEVNGDRDPDEVTNNILDLLLEYSGEA
jgi:adenylate kinase